MSHTSTEPDPAPDDPRLMAKWARAYGQNRSLGVAVFIVIFVALFAAIGIPSHFAGEALRAGNTPVLWVSLAALAVALVALVFLATPRWGGKLQERVVRRLYAKEGHVAFAPPTPRHKAWGLALGVSYGLCILASVALGFAFNIPAKYMQPISALYVVPFLVGLWWLMRPMAGYAALIWPALYTIHALLIVAGAPIVFHAPWDGLNMLIPIAGYGILAALVGHLYSRYALGKLRRLAAGDRPHSAE